MVGQVPPYGDRRKPQRALGRQREVMIDALPRRFYSCIRMRVLLAGLLLLSLTGAAFAQDAEGEVESIGYGGAYRPNCWTPMKLRLRPKVGDTRTYKIAIVQEDLDRDRVIYTRPFTLNGNPPGGRIEEHVWVYFMPQPRGLRIQGNAAEFTNLLKVFLCKIDG